MTRVLVTGAAGFIGSRIVDVLRAADHDVVGVDALIPAAHPVDARVPDGVHRVDVADHDAMLDLLDGIDVVCHQAAMVGAGVDASDAPRYARENDWATAQLLAAMFEAGCRRLVLASSMVVYGAGRFVDSDGVLVGRVGDRRPEDMRAGQFEHLRDGQPLRWALTDEDTPFAPSTSYAASKCAQEHYANAWSEQTGGSVVALRYHNVYGPWMPRDTPYAGVASLFRSRLAAGLAPLVFEDGDQMRDFVHVDDVAEANRCAIETTDSAGFQALNVCSGTPISIGTVARLLSEAADGPAPEVTGGFRLGDVRHVVADPRRAHEHIGFRAAIAPEVGIPRFASEPLRNSSGRSGSQAPAAISGKVTSNRLPESRLDATIDPEWASTSP
ncbi:NAD-dependent epimerase/dehydratase family protein [Gordonia sp. SID5947]|uniref:NAD-dependent epimerase/dehydratase family protein n=1 Tax=Gordonia sp. SID5947 TaxID=2690315 RepID=UPI0013707506|nr:NAD-dependent epimerase/dehydratase family protein [Gordonia sp. SID5947]MYR04838.1 NAD-dependent epimerase/dehydratase family protein [Gordonia sp. SID5947]